MKLISATTILLISSSGVANAALPPGYQEFMHCPPGSCSLFIEHDKGFAGPASAYYKCYDERTDQTTDAVWTGQYTEIKAPEGWIQDPGECEPQMSDPTTSLNFDKPGGLCTTDSDCRTKIRSAEPLGAVGPRLCGCYAASRQLPFDETEGQTSFRRARCRPGACDRFEAYCPLASNDNGMAECALRPIDTSSSSSSTSSSEDSPRSRPKKHTRSTTSSSTSTSSDDPPSIPKKRTGSTTTTSSTSTSSDESPPSNPIKKKRRPAYLLSATSASATSDDSSTGIVSPTPAPPAPVQAVAEM
mmetsp:Transcript_10340/g.15585  ORF Transcript_10340/g.15585 Transcript_10340/m.15585 type:complete len:301 (-) Transcript_10340:88-990(-)